MKGAVRHGRVRSGSPRCALVRHGAVGAWRAVARFGEGANGTFFSVGLAGHGRARFGKAWRGEVLNSMTKKNSRALVPRADVAAPELLAHLEMLLEKANSIQKILHVRATAGAYAKFFRTAHDAQGAAEQAEKLRLRAEIRAGESLIEMAEKGARKLSGKGGDPRDNLSPGLSEIGVKPKQSSRWQQLARIPRPVREQYLREPKSAWTTSGLITLAKFEGKHRKGEAIRKEPTPLPDGPFRVIVADPPWPYSERRPSNDWRGRPGYSGMTVEEICFLPVADRAHDDALLWLWTTNAFLDESFDVCRAWGFKYRTLLTWAKNRIGVGDWLRGQTEHCIFASRGNPVVTLTAESTLLTADVGAHSEKPEAFYRLVEAVCPAPDLGRLEMFARKPRPGWRVWGAEADAEAV